MSCGGWLGNTLGNNVSAPFRAVSSIVGGVTGASAANDSSGSTPVQTEATAAPAATVSDEAEYSASNNKTTKKRGKNSLVIPSSASSGSNGTGLNI